jgi:hypothetical protein
MMSNIDKGTKVKLNIVNMENPNSFFSCGLKPAILSLKKYRATTKTWIREGEDIVYSVNNLFRSKSANYRYHTLSFTYKFDFFEDVVYFAMTFPYSYTKLTHTITDW